MRFAALWLVSARRHRQTPVNGGLAANGARAQVLSLLKRSYDGEAATPGLDMGRLPGTGKSAAKGMEFEPGSDESQPGDRPCHRCKSAC